jgi:hypothetical protein
MLRYNEISLSKAQEEKEKLNQTIALQESDLEVRAALAIDLVGRGKTCTLEN